MVAYSFDFSKYDGVVQQSRIRALGVEIDNPHYEKKGLIFPLLSYKFVHLEFGSTITDYRYRFQSHLLFLPPSMVLTLADTRGDEFSCTCRCI